MDCWDFLRFQKGFISRVMAYWELPGEAPKVQKSVSDAYPWKHWPFGPLCGVWNPIYCRTRHPGGQKLLSGGQADPFLTTLDHPMDPPKPSQTPLNPFVTFPTTNIIPLVILQLNSTPTSPLWKPQKCQKHPQLSIVFDFTNICALLYVQILAQ